jgi:hypothetical protein
MLTGYQECESSACFVPRGSSWPSGSVAVGIVDPQDDDPRKKAGDGRSFTRVTPEVAFKTPVAHAFDRDVYLSANYRLYYEVNAASSVKSAHLDEFQYLQATLGGQTGPFMSFSTGRLPFDRRDDQVYSLGFKMHF